MLQILANDCILTAQSTAKGHKMNNIDWSKKPEWATSHGVAGLIKKEVWLNDTPYAYCEDPTVVFKFGAPMAFLRKSVNNVQCPPVLLEPDWVKAPDWATMHGYYRGRSYWVGHNHYSKTDGSEETQYTGSPLKWDNVTYRPGLISRFIGWDNAPAWSNCATHDTWLARHENGDYYTLNGLDQMVKFNVGDSVVEHRPAEPLLVPSAPKKSDFTETEWALMTKDSFADKMLCASWLAAHKSTYRESMLAAEDLHSIDPAALRKMRAELKKKRTYYIAGPMTGIPNFNRDAFNTEAARLTAAGHTVLNPATLPDGLTDNQYMDICVSMLRCATHVMMLRGWDDSRGAFAERALALKYGVTVEYQ